MNRKGLAQVVWVVPVFAGLFVAQVVGAALLRPSFIIKKAVAKCVSEGGTEAQCTTDINALTQDQRIEYIRDKAVGAPTQNFHG